MSARFLILGLLLLAAGASAQSPGAAERRLILQRLESTFIEEVKFQNATLDDWVGFLREKLRGGERPVNFIVTPAAARFAEGKTITLELRRVPARVVLDYGARLLELEVKIEPHAIVITAPQVVPAPASAPAP
jgi:hypothetical protein